MKSARVFDEISKRAAEEILEKMADVNPVTVRPDAVTAGPPLPVRDESPSPASPAAFPRPVAPRMQIDWDDETLLSILESIPDAVIAIVGSGTIVLVNRQTELLFGYARGELLGNPIEVLLPERFRTRHVSQRERYFADPQTRPMGLNLDLWGRRKNGEEFPVEISLSPLRTKAGIVIVASIRDITRRRQAESRLRNAEARYRTLVEEIPAVTFMAALDESAAAISELYVSPQIETLLGFTQKQWVEDPVLWFRQLHPEDRERWHLEFARTCSTAEPFDSVYRFISREGRVVWVHGHAKLVRDRDGKPLFLQGIAFDITERKRAEEAVRQLNQTLERRVREAVAESEQRAQELARSNEALDRFAYIASHDLREPLRTMMRYMQLMEKKYGDVLDDTAREYITKTIGGARQMNQLISDLHMHSRIGRQGEFTPVDCMAVLAEACGNLRATLEENHATVTSDQLPTVRAVGSELVLLFQNLIHNAVKFRGEQLPIIHVGARREGQSWLMRVQDNGMGIESQFLERIFGIGERLHGRKIPGTGFGLANCRRIVEHHSGTIWAESQPGVGSTFLFTLPAT